jgi:hypothetical protein
VGDTGHSIIIAASTFFNRIGVDRVISPVVASDLAASGVGFSASPGEEVMHLVLTAGFSIAMGTLTDEGGLDEHS